MRWIILGILPIALGALSIVLLAFVHWGLQHLYVFHARRFCRKRGLTPVAWRLGTAFNAAGMKTEFSSVELECRDGAGQAKIVRLLVWAFGVRKVLDEETLAPPPPVPAEMLPRSIPYNPSVRSIIFFFVLAVFFVAVVQILRLPGIAKAMVSILILSAPVLILLRRILWPRQIVISDDSMIVPIGFLRLWPIPLQYSDITFVFVRRLAATSVLSIQTSGRTFEIQDMYLPDRETFELLRYHLGTFVRVPAWGEAARTVAG